MSKVRNSDGTLVELISSMHKSKQIILSYMVLKIEFVFLKNYKLSIMKIVISPAKSLNFDSHLPNALHTEPVFLKEATTIQRTLKKKNPKNAHAHFRRAFSYKKMK